MLIVIALMTLSINLDKNLIFIILSGHNESNAFMVLSKKPFEVDGKMVNEAIFCT